MNRRQHIILNALERGGKTSSELAGIADAPVESVRRSIQTLRANGFNISFADSVTGIYRLGGGTAVAQGDGDQGDAFDTDIDTDEGFL